VAELVVFSMRFFLSLQASGGEDSIKSGGVDAERSGDL
jgi:hypothetical protein